MARIFDDGCFKLVDVYNGYTEYRMLIGPNKRTGPLFTVAELLGIRVTRYRVDVLFLATGGTQLRLWAIVHTRGNVVVLDVGDQLWSTVQRRLASADTPPALIPLLSHVLSERATLERLIAELPLNPANTPCA